MKRNIFLLFFLLFSGITLSLSGASTDSVYTEPKISIKLDARLDGNYTMNTGILDEGMQKDQLGFIGKYIQLGMDGRISDHFSYSFKYRLSQDNGDFSQFFSSIDWVNLTYHINDNFFITAGKQVLGIGGYEYDKAPIDVYFWSDFWNNVRPFQIGVKAGYNTNDGNHSIQFQVANSPYNAKPLDGLLSYNLIWFGKMDWFAPIWSVNMLEYQKGYFINYISLGNRFTFDWFTWELDYMNRASFKQKDFFADFSVVSRMDFAIGERWNVIVKGGYDQNKAQEADAPFVYDRTVVPGTEYYYYGCGFEYFPIKSLGNTLRVHAYVFANNNNSLPVSFNVGVRWRMKIFER